MMKNKISIRFCFRWKTNLSTCARKKWKRKSRFLANPKFPIKIAISILIIIFISRESESLVCSASSDEDKNKPPIPNLVSRWCVRNAKRQIPFGMINTGGMIKTKKELLVREAREKVKIIKLQNETHRARLWTQVESLDFNVKAGIKVASCRDNLSTCQRNFHSAISFRNNFRRCFQALWHEKCGRFRRRSFLREA